MDLFLSAKRALLGIAVLAVLFFGWFLWNMRHTRALAREAGETACSATHPRSFCEEQADLYGDRCFDLTYDNGGRIRRGSGPNIPAYAECIMLGDKPYWDLEAQRAKDRAAAQAKDQTLYNPY